jgi:hypothetical protein
MVGDVLLLIVLIFVVGRLCWWAGSAVLRGLAAYLALLGAYAVWRGMPVPASVLVLVFACWAGGQLIFRARHGYWRSHILRWATGRRPHGAFAGGGGAGAGWGATGPTDSSRVQSPTSGATLYDVLGVAPAATAEELRHAYRVRSQLLHPDRHAGAGADVEAEAAREMRRLNEAWEILKRPARRRRYDEQLRADAAAWVATG